MPEYGLIRIKDLQKLLKYQSRLIHDDLCKLRKFCNICSSDDFIDIIFDSANCDINEKIFLSCYNKLLIKAYEQERFTKEELFNSIIDIMGHSIDIFCMISFCGYYELAMWIKILGFEPKINCIFSPMEYAIISNSVLMIEMVEFCDFDLYFDMNLNFNLIEFALCYDCSYDVIKFLISKGINFPSNELIQELINNGLSNEIANLFR